MNNHHVKRNLSLKDSGTSVNESVNEHHIKEPLIMFMNSLTINMMSNGGLSTLAYKRPSSFFVKIPDKYEFSHPSLFISLIPFFHLIYKEKMYFSFTEVCIL